MASKPTVGLAGTGARSEALIQGLRAADRAARVVVQDPDEDARSRFAASHEIEFTCSTFEELIERVDVVILASPAPHHAPQACTALERGVHVLSEVPAVVSHEQALSLVRAARSSSAQYALAENYRYFLPHLIVRELIASGEFGEVYYGESDYFVDARFMMRDRAGAPNWKHHWWADRDGNNYPTHSLGPLMQWFQERISAVSCVGAGRGSGTGGELHDATVTLARTVGGNLLRLGFSWLSPRPMLSHHFKLQGTGGAYDQGDPRRGTAPALYLGESPASDNDALWARPWEPLEPYVARLLPKRYRTPNDLAPALDSSSGLTWELQDLWMLQDFFDAIENDGPVDVDVYLALDMTLPALAAEASIARGGAWVEVPNPRHFTAGIGADL